ncbi:MAG: flagellar biosynthetic protein FlhB [bacterium]|jgi:flagellar biosynthetic protein FlhB
MADSSEEKTEEPTQKKRDDSREEGQVAFSKELNSAALLGAYLLLFYFTAESSKKHFIELFRYFFQNINSQKFTVPFIQGLFELVLTKMGYVILPIFAVAIFLGIFISVIQVGVKASLKPITPKLEKLDPIKGFGRFFSKQAFSELLKSVFKIGVFSYLGYKTFLDSMQLFLNLPSTGVSTLLDNTFSVIGLFSFRVFLAILTMAIFDFAFQKWDMEQKLKMSKQDIKEEMKQSEGDPQLKAKIREIQKQMSQARLMQEVPHADVIVNNPTHFAIALKYDRATMEAPEIVAKGMDFLALRIMEIAKDNDIPVYRNPTIARGMYYQVEIGEAVPEEFFKAVAEILAFVYRLKKKK